MYSIIFNWKHSKSQTGFAIWSKKSDKELQRELKKALEKKALNVPDSVAMIIRAVYLEKTHTMKKMRKDHELACIGFRKWVIEQKKKTKKDPLPLARIEVSKVIFHILESFYILLMHRC